MTPSAESSCGPVKTSPEGMLRLPSELTHVRPSTRSVRSVPSASMRSSRGGREPLDQPRLRVVQLAPRGDRIVAVEEERALDQRGEVAGRHAGLLRAGRRRPHRAAPAPLHRELADRLPGARGARQPRRVDAGQLARVLGGEDPQQAVRALGVGELGGGVRRRGGRRAPPPSSPRSGRAATAAAPATPRARGSRAGARAAAARRASSRAHEHLVARLDVEAVAAPAARRSAPGQVVIDDRRRPAPAGGRAGHLDRQAGDGEAGGARQRAEVVELLDLAVLAVDAGAVRLPQDRGVLRPLVLRAQRHERAVEAPGVGADHLHAALEQPRRRLAREPGAGVEVLRRVPLLLGAGPQQHDVVGLQLVGAERRLQVRDLDPLAPRHLAHVEPHAGAQEPVERQLVDRPRALAAAGREVVPRRVDVRARVGDQRDRLRRPALAVGQVGDLAAEDLRDQRRGAARGPRSRSSAAAARPAPGRSARRGRRSSRRLHVGEPLGQVLAQHAADPRPLVAARRSGSARAARFWRSIGSAPAISQRTARRSNRNSTERCHASSWLSPPARTFAYSARVAGVIAPRSTSTLPSASS